MTVQSRALRSLSHRLCMLAGVMLLALATAACFDKEPQQRAAFIAFLQHRIIDKPGLHIPILSDKELAEIGPYADQYYIMNGFHHRLGASISKELASAMEASVPRSLEDLRNKHALISTITRGMARMQDELDKVEADADAQHKALKQPVDLKIVYDKAYERMVTIPAKIFRELMPVMANSLPVIEELAAYLDEHRDTIELRGNQTAIKDLKVRQKLAALIEKAAEVGKAAAEGKRKLRAMAEGR